jgi:hypothetical protein
VNATKKPVTLYFSTPMTLIIANSLMKENLSRVVFVEPRIRDDSDYLHRIEFIDQTNVLARYIASILQLKYSSVTYDQYLSLKPDIIESSLVNNKNSANTVIVNASDAYCLFGFSSMIRYPLTKIRLARVWKELFSRYDNSQLYIMSNSNDIENLLYKKIDLVLVKQGIEFIAPKIFKEFLPELESTFTESMTLVLPPIRHYSGENFTTNFFNRVSQVSSDNNLKLMIKPHRNDSVNYAQSFSHPNLIDIKRKMLKWIPVEFFYCLPNVKQLISVPSSSLVFAGKCSKLVLVPKESKTFRRSFLDQVPFLETNGITYEKI